MKKNYKMKKKKSFEFLKKGEIFLQNEKKLKKGEIFLQNEEKTNPSCLARAVLQAEKGIFFPTQLVLHVLCFNPKHKLTRSVGGLGRFRLEALIR